MTTTKREEHNYISLIESKEQDAQDSRDKSRKRKRSEIEEKLRGEMPWLKGKDYYKCGSFARRLHQEVLDLVQYLSPTPEEHVMRRLVVERVRQVVHNWCPEAFIMCFGSYDTQLYLPTSDLDLVMYNANSISTKPVEMLKSLAEALVNEDIMEGNVTVVDKARVPIIKFREKYTGICVDISCEIVSGLDGARIVKDFLGSTPALRPLTLLIKHYLVQRSMNEVFLGGLGSYAVLCMVMSFLQLHPIVQSGFIQAEENLGVLLLEFFELYGQYFNYDRVGIRLTNRGSYFQKSKTLQDMEKRREKILLTILDPQDPSNDIAKGTYHIIQIRKSFAIAYEIITAAIFQVYGAQSSLSAENIAQSVPEEARQTGSILGAVFRIPPDVMQNRAQILEAYQAGSLHQAVGVTYSDEPKLLNTAVNDEAMVTSLLQSRGTNVRIDKTLLEDDTAAGREAQSEERSKKLHLSDTMQDRRENKNRVAGEVGEMQELRRIGVTVKVGDNLADVARLDKTIIGKSHEDENEIPPEYNTEESKIESKEN
ncbi:uncharacterized protein VTP21DRAFT_1279 [Calcarisporiella thermophila]|uniref:uncharacterized protein n=1 Tax=Calcarisporiella thermophila TaxID=911321 RepID=UPI0037426962